MQPNLMLPPAVAALPRDPRGYPVPWFVAEVDGRRDDLRIACAEKRTLAFHRRLCWVCGQRLERKSAFIGGPLAVTNRVFGDWCMHPVCAVASMSFCPFLNGDMRRRSGREKPDGAVPLEGAHENRPELAALAVCRTESVEMLREGLFQAPSFYFVWWYRDGQRVPESEAQSALAAARRQIEEAAAAERRRQGGPAWTA